VDGWQRIAGLEFKAHRLLYYSTLGLSKEEKRREEKMLAGSSPQKHQVVAFLAQRNRLHNCTNITCKVHLCRIFCCKQLINTGMEIITSLASWCKLCSDAEVPKVDFALMRSVIFLPATRITR